VVFTGGPCGGKTTALSQVQESLQKRGFNVWIVPEAASIINQAGGDLLFGGFTEIDQVNFQYCLLLM
jgi:hypothetical protein